MAGKGLTIPLSLDPREWLRGIKVVERSLESMEDELDEVENAGDKLERALEDNFKDAARSAERAGQDMGDGLTSSFSDRINRTSLGVVGAEVADEFVSSWGEAIRAGNPAEAIYETLTNAGQVLAAALPGVGTVVGMGIATVTGIVQGIREEEARIREAIQSALGAGSDEAIKDQGYTTGAAFIQGLNEALDEEATEQANLQKRYGTDNFIDALKEAQAEADTLGVTSQQVQDIYVGTTEEVGNTIGELRTQQGDMDTLIELTKARVKNEQLGTVEGANLIKKYEDQRDRIQGLITQGERRVGVAEENAAAVQREYRDLQNAKIEAGQLQRLFGGTVVPNAGPLAANMATAVRSAKDLQYWLDQASRVNVRVAGVTGQGGPTM